MKENNATDPVSPQVQGDVKSQNNQGSLEEAVVQPSGNKSKKISNQKDLTDAPPKIARFEIEASFNNTWELPSRLSEYLERYIGRHVPDKNIKGRILGDIPNTSNIKKTFIFDIKEFLVENRKSFAINHEDALKGIHKNIFNIFGSLLRLS